MRTVRAMTLRVVAAALAVVGVAVAVSAPAQAAPRSVSTAHHTTRGVHSHDWLWG